LSISAPGIADDRLRVGISSGGQMTGSNGHYSVKVTAPGAKVTITVSGEYEPGKSKVMGTKEFRCKRVPAPLVKFCGKNGGRLSAAAMRSQNRIFAVLEDFEFDAPFVIQHFTMYVAKPRSDVISLSASANGTLTPDMTNAIKGVVPGSRVIFDNIDGIGVDGMKRQLSPVIFTVE
jgi:hypothetical protein